jgi:hypothetical protein
VELAAEGGGIAWRYKGEAEWRQLVQLEALKGADGQDGQDGQDGAPGPSGISEATAVGGIGDGMLLGVGGGNVAGFDFPGGFRGAFDNAYEPQEPGNTVLPADPRGGDFAVVREAETRGGGAWLFQAGDWYAHGYAEWAELAAFGGAPDSGALEGKANKIPAQPGIGWHWGDVSPESPLAVPAGREIEFDASKEPEPSGGEFAEHVALDDGGQGLAFGWIEDAEGRVAIGVLRADGGGRSVVEAAYDSQSGGWRDGGALRLPYGISATALEREGGAPPAGFDMGADARVRSAPEMDLPDLFSALGAERARRGDADAGLGARIGGEAEAREGADGDLAASLASGLAGAQAGIAAERAARELADAGKANIYVRQAQGITIGNNIQGMHVRVPAGFAFASGWEWATDDGQRFARADNGLSYFDGQGGETVIARGGEVEIPDFTISAPFLISSMSGSFNDAGFFYRYFDIRDFDQRIGLVSELATQDKSSLVRAVNSLKAYVDATVNASEAAGSPYASYAEFAAGAGAEPQPGKYAYVAFAAGDGRPSGGNWDRVADGSAWRLDSSEAAWSPTSDMSASLTVALADASGTSALKAAGSDTAQAWLQALRDNVKHLLAEIPKKLGRDGIEAGDGIEVAADPLSGKITISALDANRLDGTMRLEDDEPIAGPVALSVQRDGSAAQAAETDEEGVLRARLATDSRYVLKETGADYITSKSFQTGSLSLPLEVRVPRVRRALADMALPGGIAGVCAQNAGVAYSGIHEFGSTGSSTAKWVGGVLAPNGKIYGFPYNATTVLEIDPETQTAATFGSLSGTNKWRSGVLAPNGKIYGVPFSSTTVLEIDPETQTAATFGSLPESGKWIGGVLAPSGKIYGIPYDATTVLELSPDEPLAVNFSETALRSAWLNKF